MEVTASYQLMDANLYSISLLQFIYSHFVSGDTIVSTTSSLEVYNGFWLFYNYEHARRLDAAGLQL